MNGTQFFQGIRGEHDQAAKLNGKRTETLHYAEAIQKLAWLELKSADALSDQSKLSRWTSKMNHEG